MDVLKTTDDGRYRVRLETDPDPSNPRTDRDSNVTHAVTVPDRHYADIEGAGPLADAWDHFKQRSDGIELFTRYARYHGVTTAEHRPHRGPVSIWYIMPDVAAAEVPDPAAALQAEIDEYQAWAEGEVYGYIIEEATEWKRADGKEGALDTWEEVDSCWGFIGYEYAKESALSQLDDYAKNTHA